MQHYTKTMLEIFQLNKILVGSDKIKGVKDKRYTGKI